MDLPDFFPSSWARFRNGCFGLFIALAATGSGWAQGGATYDLIAQTDGAAPGGGTYGYLSTPVIGNGGAVAFSGSSGNGDRIWAGSPGALQKVAGSGEPAPGTEADFAYFGPVAINAAGRTAFQGFVSSEGYIEGLWAALPSGLTLATQVGDAAPGGILEDISALGPAAFSTSGDLALKIRLTASETSQLPGSALVLGRPGAFSLVLAEGDDAPGFTEGTRVSAVYEDDYYGDDTGSTVSLNDRGELAFKVKVTRPEFESSDGVIYAGKPGQLNIVAVEGEPAPQVPDAIYAILDSRPSISSNGYVAFAALLASGVNEGIVEVPQSALFANGPRGAGLRPLVRSGDPVPGAAGVVFGSLSNPCINRTGDVVFEAEILYPDESSRGSLWLKRLDGPPVLLAASGVFFSTPEGPREAYGVGFAGSGGFNDLHEAVFAIGFGDETTAIYRADTRPGAPMVTITKPATRKGQVTRAARIVIGGTASDDSDIAKVEYRVRQIPDRSRRALGKPARQNVRVRQAVGTTDWQFRLPLAVGRNVISITATDSRGNESEPCEITIIRYDCKK